MPTLSLLLVLPLLLPALACAAPPPAQTAAASSDARSSLPVRRVRLYETGVGYFERAGKLAPGANSISLPASHVDDALKTLIVLSDGAPVRVSAVEFASVLSEGLARVQAGLPNAKGQRLTYPILLASLRGLEVEVVELGGTIWRGRLVEVSEVPPTVESANANKSEPASGPTPPRAPPPLARYGVTLLTRESGVVRLDSERIQSLRPMDPALAARLDSAVGTASERSAQATRILRFSASGDAPLRIGYITETPVWRVTYRLLLGKDSGQALLQGWVLVHNDTDEAWRSVGLEIVNGKPDSYLYPLTAPRYLRRPLSTPDEMSTLPQLASKTADQIWGDRDDTTEADDEEESFGAGGLGLSGIGEGGGGQGYGSGHGSLGGSHRVSRATDEISVGNLASIATSDTLASGAKFHYRMAEPVTLGAHSSALVPFTSASVNASLMTRFSWGAREGRVAAQISNSSQQTLPAGPLAIYELAGLAGETSLPRLVPGQDTWASYGSDLDVELEHVRTPIDRHTTKLVELEAQRLVEHFVRRREQALRIVNRSALPRTVCVEVPVVNNATIRGADRVLYDVASSEPLAVFEVKAHSKVEPTLIMEEGLRNSTQLEGLTQTYLGELAGAKDLPAPARAALTEARDFMVRHADSAQAREQKARELQRLETDTRRLEETIEKLKGTSGNGAEPLVRRVVELETRRNRLEREGLALADADARRLPALAAILERLNSKTKPAVEQ